MRCQTHINSSKGVPQGSILGQPCPSIWIKDVAQAIGASKIHLYADDTIIDSSGPSLHSAASTLQLMSIICVSVFLYYIWTRNNSLTCPTQCYSLELEIIPSSK